jgi:predicted permease
MKLWASVRIFVLTVSRRSDVERDMDEELRAHIQNRAEDLERSGLPRPEAERRARVEFGGNERFKEECREAMGTHFFDALLQDLKVGVRMLRRVPGFTAVAVLTLALGIAVNATMFSMVSAFLMRRPPGHDPERVAVVTSINAAPVFQADVTPVSVPNYLAWRAANHVFGDLAANEERGVNLSSQQQSGSAGDSAGAAQPERLRAAAVTPNYFSVLGAAPQIGRTFVTGEDQPGHEHVVIVSHDLWERRFGSDPSIVERSIRLNRENYDVIGVMPESFRMLGFVPQLWTPLVLSAADQSAAARRDRSLFLFARIKDGVTLEQVRAEMGTLVRRTDETFPDTEKGWGVAVRTLPDFLIHSFGIRDAIVVLMTAVGFVLMISCANVAGLLLARATARRKELSIRVALGAGRLRIVRQLLTEGLVIAILGGGLGVLLSYWGIGFLRANLSFNEAISAVPITLDWNVVLFALVVSLVSALLCGVAPSLNASRADINVSLKNESRAASGGRSRSLIRKLLVTAEVALALFLLIGVGLLIRGIYQIEHQDLGFRSDHLLTASLMLDDARYSGADKKRVFVQNVLDRLRQASGAEAVAVTSDLPATGPDSVTLIVKDHPELPTEQRLSALDFVITPDYFRAAGIPVKRGRTFTELDNFAAPAVVLVNQEFVHRYFQDRDPLGRQIQLDVGEAAPHWSEIVGVVSNVKTNSQETRDDPEVYEPFLQRPVSSLALMLRTTSDPDGLASALRSAVAQADPDLPLFRLMSMPALIEGQKGGTPFFERALSCFAILALILAAIGIYGLVAYSVGQRIQEIGIRMAMGARSSNVLGMVLWDGLKVSALGAGIGLVLALPLPRLFNAMFSGILHVHEPGLYVIVPAAILSVAMLAAYVPARRAMRVDPLVALRYE